MFPVLSAYSTSGYSISNSLRFQSASTQYLTRTPASAGNRQKWTWSAWLKKGTLNNGGIYYSAGTVGSATYTDIQQGTNDAIQIAVILSGTQSILCSSAAVFRDPSSWYHVVVAFDTTQATNSNGVKLYINGVQQTLSFTSYTQNVSTAVNNNVIQQISGLSGFGAEYFDGYQAEVNLIDGQALTPSSFGSTDPTSGQWIAKKYSGTYGTNGFYLPFSNGTSTTTLGSDSSGNSNNWTLTNFTRSAGVNDCWMYDVPSGNGGASGTQPNSNYPVLNVINSQSGGVTISQANLKFAAVGGATSANTYSTIGMTSGKWYCEVTALGTDVMVGIANAFDFASSAFIGSASSSWGYYRTGNKYNAGSAVAYGAAYTTNDVIGIAFDADAGTLTFYKNNTSQGTAFSSLASGTYFFAVGNNATNHIGSINFGQRSFAYTPPTGFKALCTANLPVATIKQGNKYMDATLFTGNGASNNIVNAGAFKPDLVWIKSRSYAENNWEFDSVRGVNVKLSTNQTIAEATGTNQLNSFNSNGFSLGADPAGQVNANAQTYVGWQWQAGQGSTSSNTSGSITSTVSVSTTAGFSIVNFTGTGNAATVGHGLGVSPKMIICKNRVNTTQWLTYHVSLGNTNYIALQSTAGYGTFPVWDNTTPTSSVFSIGASSGINVASQNTIAYCFAEIAGFSKFGSYTGNGSADGTFVYTGFRPKFVMIKNSSSVTDWNILDTSRNTYNVAGSTLQPDNAGAEQNGWNIDILSNGFKVRTTLNDLNGSGNTIIFAAFAESPFASSNAR